jgi:hypothetical protein
LLLLLLPPLLLLLLLLQAALQVIIAKPERHTAVTYVTAAIVQPYYSELLPINQPRLSCCCRALTRSCCLRLQAAASPEHAVLLPLAVVEPSEHFSHCREPALGAMLPGGHCSKTQKMLLGQVTVGFQA